MKGSTWLDQSDPEISEAIQPGIVGGQVSDQAIDVFEGADSIILRTVEVGVIA